MSDVETIKHAAVKSEDGWIFIGKCHADCFHKAHHIKVKMSQKADDQGFVTSLGRYARRGAAAQIARRAGQIDKPTQLLFSEDLWSDMYSGKYDYCEIKGYVLKANPLSHTALREALESFGDEIE